MMLLFYDTTNILLYTPPGLKLIWENTKVLPDDQSHYLARYEVYIEVYCKKKNEIPTVPGTIWG